MPKEEYEKGDSADNMPMHIQTINRKTDEQVGSRPR